MNTRQLNERIRRWICGRDGTGKFIANCERRWSERAREQENGKMTDLLNISKIGNICLLPEDLDKQEDPRTPTLRRVSYGIVLPTICCLGIIGNILNLIVLTRRNMRGTAYVYMRGERSFICLSLFVSSFLDRSFSKYFQNPDQKCRRIIKFW